MYNPNNEWAAEQGLSWEFGKFPENEDIESVEVEITVDNTTYVGSVKVENN